MNIFLSLHSVLVAWLQHVARLVSFYTWMFYSITPTYLLTKRKLSGIYGKPASSTGEKQHMQSHQTYKIRSTGDTASNTTVQMTRTAIARHHQQQQQQQLVTAFTDSSKQQSDTCILQCNSLSSARYKSYFTITIAADKYSHTNKDKL